MRVSFIVMFILQTIACIIFYQLLHNKNAP